MCQIRAGGGCVRVVNCLKYLKRGWNRKERRENNFKKGREQAGSRGGCHEKCVCLCVCVCVCGSVGG